MKRGQYVRLIEYELTTGLKAPDLYTLSLISTPVLTMEGWLTEHIVLGGRIHLTARYRQGQIVCRLPVHTCRFPSPLNDARRAALPFWCVRHVRARPKVVFFGNCWKISRRKCCTPDRRAGLSGDFGVINSGRFPSAAQGPVAGFTEGMISSIPLMWANSTFASAWEIFFNFGVSRLTEAQRTPILQGPSFPGGLQFPGWPCRTSHCDPG